MITCIIFLYYRSTHPNTQFQNQIQLHKNNVIQGDQFLFIPHAQINPLFILRTKNFVFIWRKEISLEGIEETEA